MLFSKAADLGGLPGVTFIFGVLALALIVALYICCRREGGVLPATIATFAAVVGASYAVSARPQIVSMILLAVALAAWLQTSRDLRARWWLVPLTWVWATAHGLWSFGVVLGLLCAVGIVLDRGPQLGWAARTRLLGLPVLCLIAAALTPVGPRLLMSQLTVANRTTFITEWGPTSFHRVPAIFVAGMIAVVLLIWLRRGGGSWTRILLLFLAAAATAYYTRLVPVGAVIAAPLLTAALREQFTFVLTVPRRRFEAGALILGLVACLVGLVIAIPRTAAQPKGVPLGLAPRLAALPQGTTVYDDDVLGGWLEWRFPRLNPVIDGMFDAYPVNYLSRWQRAQELMPGWPHFVASTNARVAVLQEGSAVANALQVQLGWRHAQTDNGWVYLIAPGN